MNDDLTRRIEAVIDAHAYETLPGCASYSASLAIASLIAEERGRAFSEGHAVANGERRMCVNCGKTVPADRVKPGDELTECIGPYGMAARAGTGGPRTSTVCTFDATPQEAWEFWSKCWHDLHQSLPAIRASARRKALEEALAAVEAEHLEGMTDPCQDATDVAYDTAVAHCAAAIRSLAKEATNGQ